MPRKLWTKRELRILRRDYPHIQTRVLACRIGRPVQKIYAQASKLGLHKSAAFMADAKASGRFDKLSKAGEAFRYPQGHVPANKGLRRPGWHRGRMRETQFKKGQRPQNSRPVGSTRIDADGFLLRKVREAKYIWDAWRPVHRLLWEEHHGPIPPKHCIAFKDRNRKVPVLLGNLELISMAENARRNHWKRSLPRDLALAIMARGALKRRIRERREHEPDDQGPARKAVRHDRRADARQRPDGDRSRGGGRPGRGLDHRKREGRGRSDEDRRRPGHRVR